jgi:hypothetical protein
LKSFRRWAFIFLMGAIAPACLGGGGSNSKPAATLPLAPTTLDAPTATTARIDLTWVDTSDNEFEFRIERSDDGGVNYVQVGTASKNVQGFSDFGLQANKTYFYRVAAWNAKGYSAWAGPVAQSTSGLSWSNPAFTGGPTRRANHTGIYDAIGKRMIVFGGWDENLNFFDEVWAYDLQNLAIPGAPWTQLQPDLVNGIPAPFRFGHTAIYDSANRRMIVFGGQDDTITLSDQVFIFDLANNRWSNPTPSGTAPSPRWLHIAVYDSANQQMIVHGGNDGSNELDDTFILSLPAAGTPAWSSPAVGSRPLRRSQHASIFDPVLDQLVLFGGLDQQILLDGSSLNNETWTFSSSRSSPWIKLLFGGTPDFTIAHSAVYDAANRRMVIFAGADTSTTLTNEMWGLKLDGTPSWIILNPTSGSPPGGRMSHSAVYDSLHRRMIIYGGTEPTLTVFQNEVWVIGL